jgi:hypothetical protein
MKCSVKRIMLVPTVISGCGECIESRMIVTNEGATNAQICMAQRGLPCGYITFKTCPIWEEAKEVK